MGIRDDLVNGIAGLFPQNSQDEVGQVAGGVFDATIDFFWAIMLIVVVCIALFVLVRTYRWAVAYAGDGEQLGSWKLHIMGKSTVKGNLNIRENITEERINILSQVEELKESIKDIKRLWDEGKLNFYDFRITDYAEEAWDLKGGKDAIVFSLVDFNTNDYSWMDAKGDRSILTPSFRLKSKNVFCFEESKYIPDLENEYGKPFDCYYIIPVPRKTIIDIMTGKEIVKLELTTITTPESIVMAGQYMPTMSETFKKLKPTEKELNRLRDELTKAGIRESDIHRLAENYRHEAIPAPIIGWGKPPKSLEKYSLIFWVLAGLIMGGMGYGLPDIIPELQGVITNWMGLGITSVILLALYKYSEAKQQHQQKVEAYA